MLSFPAPNWKTALASATKSTTSRPPGSRFGRAASLIIPRVYLSDYFTACDGEELSRLGITHVISVIEYDTTIPASIPEEHKLQIRVADHPDVDISVHFKVTTGFIRLALAENETNKVLVHCLQGISRSATVVCAYLIATSNMLTSEAIAYTQAKRGIVCPNQGFRQQLEVYAQQFGEQSTKTRGSPRGKVSKISGNIAERMRQFTIRPDPAVQPRVQADKNAG